MRTSIVQHSHLLTLATESCWRSQRSIYISRYNQIQVSGQFYIIDISNLFITLRLQIHHKYITNSVQLQYIVESF